MNVVSVDLCREIYQLTGWVDQESWHSKFDIKDAESTVVEQRPVDNDLVWPAYDLKYLMSKLPKATRIVVGGGNNISYKNTNKTSDYSIEDAAAKLCIDLLKQGIISA